MQFIFIFRFAGILMGIGNTIGNISGIFAPIVAAQMTPDVRLYSLYSSPFPFECDLRGIVHIENHFIQTCAVSP